MTYKNNRNEGLFENSNENVAELIKKIIVKQVKSIDEMYVMDKIIKMGYYDITYNAVLIKST